MRKIFAAALVFVGFQSAVFATLELIPREIALSADGPPAKRYFFSDDGKRLSFRLDNKMSVDGGGDAVAFHFEDLSHAAMRVSHSHVNPAVSFDEKNLASYRSIARNLLGTDASNVQIEEERPNAIAINGWTSHQIIFTYDFFGQHYRRSITFLNYSRDEQLIVDVTATTDDYVKAYARGYRVLNSITDQPISNAGPT